MLKGTIMKGIGGFYYVETPEGLIECRARGRFRKDGETPVVGDIVTVKRTEEDKEKGYVEEIEPRKNVFIRPPVANIDQLVIAISVKDPEPNLLLADRLTVTAEAAGVSSVICITKCDLDAEKAEKIAEIYQKSGYPVLSISSKDGVGIDAVKEILQNKTTALAGNSGVGKSSLLNELCASFDLVTGSVSEKTKRGRHTTRHTELLKLPFGGFVFDTPGFSSYETEGIAAEELANLFPDFEGFTTGCRFAGCAHVAEPSCSVKEAVEAGKISNERYENYTILYKELKEKKKW